MNSCVFSALQCLSHHILGHILRRNLCFPSNKPSWFGDFVTVESPKSRLSRLSKPSRELMKTWARCTPYPNLCLRSEALPHCTPVRLQQLPAPQLSAHYTTNMDGSVVTATAQKSAILLRPRKEVISRLDTLLAKGTVLKEWMEKSTTSKNRSTLSKQCILLCTQHLLFYRVRCSSVVTAFNRGVMGCWINHSWWTHWAIFCSSLCSMIVVCAVLFVGWCI